MSSAGRTRGESVPSNVEIKFRLRDPVGFRRRVKGVAECHETLKQEDTFFASPRGRLKLRCFPNGLGELIYYDRVNGVGPAHSRYWISRTQDPHSLRLTLSNALGIVGIVRKTRDVFWVGQTRIHLDDVEGLGTFAELEVVMQPGQTIEDGTTVAKELMQKLKIDETDLADGAYIDMLGKRKADKPDAGDA